MLYQLSRKNYNNLYSSSKGYKIGKSLQFANNKIENRYFKGLYIQNLSSIINFHIAELIICALDCFTERQDPYLTYIQIVFTAIFLLWIKKAQSILGLQIMSFALQAYFVLRFSQLNLPFEFFMLLLIIWGHNHVISWQIMSIIFLFIYPLLSQVFQIKQSFLWPQLLSQNGQRQIYEIQIEVQGDFTLKASEIEFEYTILSVLIYYLLSLNNRNNWKVLDQAKRSERAYVNLFQKNTTPTFIVNHQGNILELNESSKQIFGQRRVSYANCSFFKLVKDKQELEGIKQAFEQATLTKETINVRANITVYNNESESIGQYNSKEINGVQKDQQGNGLSKTSQNNKTQNNGDGESNLNSKNGVNGLSINENSVAPSPQMASLSSKKQNMASPPIRHSQLIAPPQISKNTTIQKIPYPFLSEQFDDILKNEYLGITDIVSSTKYYLITISPFIWKESTAFLINLVDISETQDFVKISNFFLKNLNERLISVLSIAEEDYQKWGNLAQLSQIKQTDLRELSAVISEQHNILSLTSLLKYLNQMYTGTEKGKSQDFQITNLIIQTIEVHSVRLQNYMKKIDLVFEGFPPQVNGDPNSFYFVLHNLIYLMTYNCEYSEVDLSVNCTFKTYVDRSSSLVLSFEFDFTATLEQIEFFTKMTKKFEDLNKCIVQNDFIGHDILETLYLLTLNNIKLNGGQIHLEVSDLNKKNEQNQPQSQQNIAQPQSSQNIKPEPQSSIQNKLNEQNKQNPINNNKENIQGQESQFKRLNIVLEQIFNTAEMHTIKRQGESSQMDSPAVTPFLDKKGAGRKYHALSKPPQINLSYTRIKEKQKDKYQWKQCKEEEKKQHAQIGLTSMRRPEIQKVRNFQNFGVDSDESIPQTQQKSDNISPLTKQQTRKPSTHIAGVGEEQKQGVINPQSAQNNSTSNQNIPMGHPSGGQIVTQHSKEISQQQLSQNHIATSQQIPQVNSSGQIKVKNLENISESSENIDNLFSNRKSHQDRLKTEIDSADINSDLNDFLSEDTNNMKMSNSYKKEIKKYLKLYNSNIIKDLSKIVKNVLESTKLQEDYDLRFIDKSSDNLSNMSHNNVQFCSPQLNSNSMKKHYKPLNIHSAFKEYINPAKVAQNQAENQKNLFQRKDSQTINEETPKSVVVSNRQSKTSFPSLITMSPLVVNNFRFRGESKSSDTSKDQNMLSSLQFKKEQSQIPWNKLISFEVHQSRLKKHVRKWILQDVWNRIYKKTETVLVVSADFDDMSVMKQVFQQKKDFGRELDFSELNQAFEKYMEYLRESQVYKYIMLDLRLNLNDIKSLITQIKMQEAQSKTIPRSYFVGFNSYEYSQYQFQLDFTIIGEVEVLKLIPFLKILKEKK